MRHLPALKEVPCIKNLRLVVSVPIPLRTQRAGAAQEVRGTSDLRGPEWNVEPRDAKLFYLNYRN